MKSTRRFLVTAVVSLLVALVVCAAWVFFRFQQYPIRLAEQELRTNLPHDLERIAHDEQWSWMGDGFSIWVYQLPTEVAADLVSRCESVGMRRGKLIEQSYRVTVPERYIDPEAEGCYAFKMHYERGIKFIAISSGKLVVYVSS